MLFIDDSLRTCELFTWLDDQNFDLINYPQLEAFLRGYIPVDLSYLFISHFLNFKEISCFFGPFLHDFITAIKLAVWSPYNDKVHE